MVKRAAFLALALAVAGCASAPVDRAQRPTGLISSPANVSVTCVPVSGEKIIVTTTGESKLTGELLAADPEQVVVLVADHQVLHLRADQIERADVNLYSNGAIVALLTAWAIAGTASALTHGVYFAISGPSWALASTAAIAPVAADGDRWVTVTSGLGRLHQYARFPGGMPHDVNESSIVQTHVPACD